ncbi:MAG: hypothetical protein QNJ14_07285 [Woeseiaceae bacterium]|nr:hypothetical protein [Woeseiaceae bacterium]
MKDKPLVLGIVLTVLLFGAGCSSEDVGLTPTQQVYEVVMNERMPDALTEVIVLSRTEAQYLREGNKDELRSYIQREVNVPDALLDRLFESAETSVALDWSPVMINAKFVDKAEISSDSNWSSRQFGQDFRAAFPEHQEFYALSDVALSDDQSEAAVVLSHYCPVMCGSGEYLLYLKKTGIEWNVEGGTFFWIT